MILLSPSTSQPISRSLRQGNYSPDWRLQVFQQHGEEITKAKHEFKAVNSILSREKDPFVRQLILHEFGRGGLLGDAIRFFQFERFTRTGAAIKAMVVASLSPDQIAEEVGTNSFYIIVFEKLAFDLRRYLEHRTWLKLFCYGPLGPHAPHYRRCESRWLRVAFGRGSAGLKPMISGPLEAKPTLGEEEANRPRRILVSRVGDAMVGSEMDGIPPSERDVQLLVLLEHALRQLTSSTALQALSYPKPKSLEQEKKQAEVAKTVAGLSPASRRKIAAVIQNLRMQSVVKEQQNGT